MINSDHPIFKDTHPAGASHIMALPILLRKCNDFNPAWNGMKDAQGIGYLNNEHAARLDGRLWTSESSQADSEDPSTFDMGNVLVVRDDQKSIQPEQVEALVSFNVLQHMNGNNARLREIGSIRVLEIESKKIWTRDVFERFFVTFKKMKLDGGFTEWKDIVSPYET